MHRQAGRHQKEREREDERQEESLYNILSLQYVALDVYFKCSCVTRNVNGWLLVLHCFYYLHFMKKYSTTKAMKKDRAAKAPTKTPAKRSSVANMPLGFRVSVELGSPGRVSSVRRTVKSDDGLRGPHSSCVLS